MGRPKTTGSGQPMVVRMHNRQISAIDSWIAMQGEDVSRPEAIRRLVDLALESGKKGGKHGR
jgi:Arc/MetJ-type ribon-helix-helix transcriptional regulator